MAEPSREDLARYLTERQASDALLLGVLCDGDSDSRRQGIAQMAETVREWIRTMADSPESREQLRIHLPGLLRLRIEWPFDDERKVFEELLAEIEAADFPIPVAISDSPSRFIPLGVLENFDKTDGKRPPEKADSDAAEPDRAEAAEGDAPESDKDKTAAKEFIEELCIRRGRVSHLFRIMLFFPAYTRTLSTMADFLFREGGPLPVSWRHYIAIMAASRYHCLYLKSYHEVEFFEAGGDISWLQGLSHAPRKLQKLAEINAILAHQPWLLRESHIHELVNGSGDNWSISELIPAIVLLTFFHALCSVTYGVNVVPEIDRAGGIRGAMDTIASFPGSPSEQAAVANEQDTLDIHNQEVFLKLQSHETTIEEASEKEPAEKAKLFEEAETKDAEELQQETSRSILDLSRFWGGVVVARSDFDVKSPEYSIFRTQDFNWEEHGYSFIEQYYPGAADVIDNLFTATLNLTDNSIYDKANVDTGPLRRAVWYYVLRIHGLSHDEYNYGLINDMLKYLKRGLKKITCTPQLFTKADYSGFGLSLHHHEKLHLAFLVMSAKFQATLLWALRAISKATR